MKRRAFTMIEALLSLSIYCFSFVLLASILPLIQSLQQQRFAIEDEIALRQLRRLLLLSEDIQVNAFELTFWYQDDWFTLSQDGNRLVRKEGYMIYMEDLDFVEFTEKGGCIYLTYEKNKQINQRILSC